MGNKVNSCIISIKNNFNLKEFLTMTIGTLIVACGVYFFKFPNNFSTGGVSGISVILGALVKGISTGQFVFIINMILLLIGFIFLGKGFGGKTTYCSILLSLSITLLEKLVPLSSPITDEPFLELIFAVLLPSVGSAFLFYSDASSGGTDIVAMIFKKYTKMNIGTALFISDAIIAFSTLFVFGPKTGLFSILGLLSKSFIVDNVISSLTLCKNCVIIIEKKHTKEVCDFIIKYLHRGVTIADCRGYYTNNEKTEIITVIKKSQIYSLREKIKGIDEKAFLVVTNTNEAYGRGFNLF